MILFLTLTLVGLIVDSMKANPSQVEEFEGESSEKEEDEDEYENEY